MNIEDLKPLWQNYKAEIATDEYQQESDIQLIINKSHLRKTSLYFLNQRIMNAGLYLFLLICTNGC